MGDAASLGVTPAASVADQIGLVTNSVFPSLSNAGFIGGLSQDNTDLDVLSQLTPQVKNDFYTFNFEQGSALKLSFNATVGPLGDANNDAPGTTVDGTAVGLRYQLYDITGTLIADSDGTPAQQAAYANLTSSTGLTASNGGYYVQVSAAPGTTLSTQQIYNFQLYSGTTYSTSFVSTAQTQAYDPNLFVSAASTVNPSSSNLNLYNQTASLSGSQSSALGIGNLIANQSQLDASSTLNTLNSADYYQFNFQQGQALKFTLDNTTVSLNQVALRAQIYDSNGNLIADNYGTQAQQQAYTELASGEGLAASNGSYVAKISYAPGADITQTQTYNLELNSGTSYSSEYTTIAQLPSTSTAGSTPNVGVFTNANAQLFTAQQYHQIGETAESAVEIGWLQANQSSLDVVSQLTTADKQDYYNLTLQQGSNLKLAFQNSTNTAATRIQLLDTTGTQVIADNYGTPAQKAAFAQLTSSTGLAAQPAQYVVSVGYAPGASAAETQTYNFQIYSGDTYLNSYKTTASAQTYQNAILGGNPNVVGYSAAAATASALADLANGTTTQTNIIDALIV